MLKRSPTLEPSLENLAYVLRHQELWPEDFVWNYAHAPNCAIGLCTKLYRQPIDHLNAKLREEYGAFNKIFNDSGDETETVTLFGFIPIWQRKLEMNEITPEIVADRIDNWLAKQK
jgi:hypothetical protein